MNVMLTEGGDSLKLADFGLAMSMAEKAEEDNTDEVSGVFCCFYCARVYIVEFDTHTLMYVLHSEVGSAECTIFCCLSVLWL